MFRIPVVLFFLLLLHPTKPEAQAKAESVTAILGAYGDEITLLLEKVEHKKTTTSLDLPSHKGY